MQDRLRRLDALFAEKVLGCKVHTGPETCTVCKGSKITPERAELITGPRGKLGFNVVEAGEPCWQCSGTGETDWLGGDPFCRCDEQNHNDCETAALPPYTRSLDAIHDGMKDNGRFCCRNASWDYDYVYEASVTRDDDDHQHPPHRGQSTDHPAEALVLACLRAVGVSEEELG